MPSPASAVSIIMPVFNAERFLAEAIESVLAQDLPEAWELWIIDDGSRDQSATIAQHYASRFPACIRLLFGSDGAKLGTSAARNLGIRHASAPVLAFLDADDVWLPGMLRTQLAVLRHHPAAALVYANAERTWDMSLPCATAHGVTGVNELPPLLPSGIRSGLLPVGEPLRWWLADETLVPCTCTVLARTHLVREAGGFVDAFDGLYDDQAFYVRLMLNHPVAVSDRCVARYRKHYDSCCAQTWHNDPLQQRARSRFDRWLTLYRKQLVSPEAEFITT